MSYFIIIIIIIIIVIIIIIIIIRQNMNIQGKGSQCGTSKFKWL